MRRLNEPSHLDLCCLQKSVIIACGSERVKADVSVLLGLKRAAPGKTNNCHRTCFRSSCSCTRYHPGICSPFIHSVVSNGSVSGQSDCAHPYRLVWAFAVPICPKSRFASAAKVLLHDVKRFAFATISEDLNLQQCQIIWICNNWCYRKSLRNCCNGSHIDLWRRRYAALVCKQELKNGYLCWKCISWVCSGYPYNKDDQQIQNFWNIPAMWSKCHGWPYWIFIAGSRTVKRLRQLIRNVSKGSLCNLLTSQVQISLLIWTYVVRKLYKDHFCVSQQQSCCD